MHAPLRLLIVEDSEDDALLIVRDLKRAGYEPRYERVDSAATLRAALEREAWDIIVSDFNMPQFTGTDALKLLRERDPDTPFIFVSGTIGEDTAVEAMRAGAQDYVTKGNLKRLVPAIERELRDAAVHHERRASEARFRRVVESAMIGILFWDVQGRIMDANDAFLRIVGYTREDLEAGRIDRRAITPPEYEAGDANALEEFAATGTYTPFEKEYIRKDGSRVPVIVGGALFPEPAHPGVAFVIDITERKRAADALRTSEERYRVLFERHPHPLWVFDRESLRFLEVNEAAVRQYGYSREEFLAMTIEAIRPPSEVPVLHESLRRAHVGLHAAGMWRHQKKDGSIIEVDATAHDVDLFDRPARLVSAVDVTERRRAEEQLAERARVSDLAADIGAALTRGTGLPEVLQGCCESLVRHLDAAFARIWTLNEVENVLELQASAGLYTHLDGAHSRVPVGQYKIGLIAAERRPHLTNTVLGDARVHDQEWAKREGMVAFAGYPLLVQDRLVGVLAMFARHPFDAFVQQALAAVADGIAIGISRKRVEAALTESARRFRALIEHSADAIALFAPDGTITYASPATTAVLGYVPAEFEGRNALELIHPDDLARIRPDLLAGLQGPAPKIALEARVRRKDGSWRLCEGTFTNLFGDSAVRAVVANYRDITERRQLEQQLRQAQRMEAIGRLAGGVAHDFNNVLTAIFGYADLVLEDLPVGSPSRQDLAEIRKAAERASALTRQLLAFSRQQVLEPVVLSLNELVEDIDKMVRRLIGEDIDLRLSLSRDLGNVRTDPGQMQQVIMNLVVNSRDAMPTGGKLVLETSNTELSEQYAEMHQPVAPGPYVMLAVSDTGCGMDAETKARVFEPFFTTKEKGKGTGLGLSTVYGIVKQSGGYVWVYSEPGRGTTFKIYLPRVDAPAQPPAQRPEAGSVAGTETILLGEDDDMLRPLAKGLLERLGYTVLEATNTEEALAIAARHAGPIHLLVADVVMPGASGRDLARRLSESRPETRTLYMSGYTDDAIVHHGMLEPGLNFLQKPFTPAVLARKVRDVLDAI